MDVNTREKDGERQCLHAETLASSDPFFLVEARNIATVFELALFQRGMKSRLRRQPLRQAALPSHLTS